MYFVDINKPGVSQPVFEEEACCWSFLRLLEAWRGALNQILKKKDLMRLKSMFDSNLELWLG